MNLWLGKRRNGSIDLIDGQHDEPEGVSKAAALHDIIFGDDSGPFVMVEISDVPPLLKASGINHDAAEACGELVRLHLPRPVGDIDL